MAFDLDDEELEATRKLNGVGKEKTADEMFEELGYKKNFEDKYRANYENDGFETIINFDKEYKDVRVYNNGFDMQELQAINKKVQELGWKG